MVEIYGKQKEYKKFLKDICLKNKNPTKIEIVERIKITSQIKDDYGAMLSIFYLFTIPLIYICKLKFKDISFMIDDGESKGFESTFYIIIKNGKETYKLFIPDEDDYTINLFELIDEFFKIRKFYREDIQEKINNLLPFKLLYPFKKELFDTKIFDYSDKSLILTNCLRQYVGVSGYKVKKDRKAEFKEINYIVQTKDL